VLGFVSTNSLTAIAIRTHSGRLTNRLAVEKLFIDGRRSIAVIARLVEPLWHI